jgi:hypothetical protein
MEAHVREEALLHEAHGEEQRALFERQNEQITLYMRGLRRLESAGQQLGLNLRGGG